MLEDKIADAKRIILKAQKEYDPCVWLAGLSGGGDSMTLLHLMLEIGVDIWPFHCNTGIGVEATREFVRQECIRNGLWLIEKHPSYKTYEEIVLEIGFPGPPQHFMMYAMLKERQIRDIVREFDETKKGYRRHKAILTGVRKSESARRKVNVSDEIQKRGFQLWVSPIMNWDEDDKQEFLDSRGINVNPVSKCLGMSGECLCGAYARKGELERIKQVDYATYEYIVDLQKRVKAKGFTWGWEDVPPTGMKYAQVMNEIKPGYMASYLEKQIAKKVKKKLEDKGQIDMFFQPMCTGCNAKHSMDEKKTKYLLGNK